MPALQSGGLQETTGSPSATSPPACPLLCLILGEGVHLPALLVSLSLSFITLVNGEEKFSFVTNLKIKLYNKTTYKSVSRRRDLSGQR